MSEQFDIVVVGAGPAGSSCAHYLSKLSSLRVGLLDSCVFPRDKSCGDGIGVGAVPILIEMGLEDLLASHPKISNVVVGAPSGETITGNIPTVENQDFSGYVIPRLELDNAIYGTAVAAGATDLTGNGLSSATYDNEMGRWSLTLKSANGDRCISCDYLIGADGARSKVRRLFNQPQNSDEQTAIAVRKYGDVYDINPSEIRLDFTKDELATYGWIFPINGSYSNVGIGVRVNAYKSHKMHLDTLLEEYEDYCANYTKLDLNEKSRNASILPLGSEMPRFAFPNGALLGDAASMINPFTGEGIYYSLWAGKVLATEISKRANYAEASRRYEKAFLNKFKKHFQLNQQLFQIIEKKGRLNSLVKRFQNDQRVIETITGIGVGDQKAIPPSIVLKVSIAWLKAKMSRLRPKKG